MHKIELRYGLDSFRSDWRHCSLGSNFLAETAFSTPFAKQMASTAINELLEFAFRNGAKGSKSWVEAVVEQGSGLNLSMDVNIKPQLSADLHAEADAFLSSAQSYYQERLGQESPGAFFGLAYLSETFGCIFQLAWQSEYVLRLTAKLQLRRSSDG
jgi:hypothetical protein